MAVTFALVEATPFRLRYLVTRDTEPPGAALPGEVPPGNLGTLPNDGGPSPDLLTDLDASRGPLRSIIRARLDGIGTIPPGALTQGQARAILLSDGTVSVGNDLVPRAIVTIEPRTTDTGESAWTVDASVDAQGDPILIVTGAGGIANRLCYLDIHARHSLDR